VNETLGARQRRFLPLVAKLIDWAYAQGYQLTAGELYRPSEQAALNAAKAQESRTACTRSAWRSICNCSRMAPT